MIKLRKDTFDRIIYTMVVNRNEYNLPEHFASDDIIIDIGAHIGTFAYTVLQRGAGLVYCAEPEPQNFAFLAQNLAPYIRQKRAHVLQAAVWRSDANDDVLYYDGYTHSQGIVNTGGGGVLWGGTGPILHKVALDSLLETATNCGKRRVRLLKIDCEGAEWPILFTSRRLHLVDEICGEFHEIGAASDHRSPPFTLNGRRRFTGHDLSEYLSQQGFTVQYEYTGTMRENPRLGLFSAQNGVSAMRS